MDAGAVALLGVVVTLGIAIVGWNRGRTAQQTADRAVALAQAAEDRADRLEAMATEHADIEWDHAVVHAPGQVTFRNVGTDTAHEVELVFDPPIEGRRSISVGSLAPKQSISLEVPYQESTIVATVGRSIKGVRVVGTARLTWRSEAGTPGIRTQTFT